jgi:hypothetical protein
MRLKQFCRLMSVLLLAAGLAAAQNTITFEAPGAGTAAGQGTLAQGIDPLGTTFGYYIDGSSVAHGFLRVWNGYFVTFSAPGAGTGAGQGTFASSLNPEGTITGYPS